MTSTRAIPPADSVESVVTVPGSKSITNRALLIAALADGDSALSGALDSEDTRVMAGALRTLGVGVTGTGPELLIKGRGGFPNKTGELYVANSGTTARFLTAALAFSNGRYRLDGKERMRRRPIGDLLDALQKLGADTIAEMGDGCPPILVRPARSCGGEAEIKGEVSSQFLSALLMAAPLAERTIRLTMVGRPISRPYIAMTLAVMKAFGVEVETDAAFSAFHIPAGAAYRPTDYRIEPDASAASYFFALPAILGGRVTVTGLSQSSLQGDVGFVDALAAMGCAVDYKADQITVSRSPRSDDSTAAPLRGIDVDMGDISDTAQTLAVVALFAETPTRIHNIAHVRGKETDRIAAVAAELRKLGAQVDEFADGLTVRPNRAALHGARIATYDDHRMAMSFALAGLAIPGVIIEDPECTAKTYPNFFADLDRALRR